jgi:hypothetical protein
MDILKDKTYKDYDYTCRYSSTPYYYNTEDNKYEYGVGTQISKDVPYTAHKVLDTDTLDYLSLKYYNNPTYFWIIAYFNDIFDMYEPLINKFDIIKIPNITSIIFENPR